MYKPAAKIEEGDDTDDDYLDDNTLSSLSDMKQKAVPPGLKRITQKNTADEPKKESGPKKVDPVTASTKPELHQLKVPQLRKRLVEIGESSLGVKGTLPMCADLSTTM